LGLTEAHCPAAQSGHIAARGGSARSAPAPWRQAKRDGR
jgi:hypothetical protein